ncbi:Protein TIC 22, chloroplastic, partial [Linum perenne]
ISTHVRIKDSRLLRRTGLVSSSSRWLLLPISFFLSFSQLSSMEPFKPSNPLLSFSSFLHQQCLRIGSEFSTRLGDTTRALSTSFPAAAASAMRLHLPPPPLFASVSQAKQSPALSSDYVAKRLTGTTVYTVSNTNNEFVLISDPDGAKSIGLLCFRKEDAEAFLSQVRSRRKELRSAAKVVPITLEQVYMLKVEGIAFRFLPDPVQIKNALEMKTSTTSSGFDGVPVFQSELLVVKKKNKRFFPIYFQKVGSFEDVLRKIETSEKNSGWGDLIFIPPGKTQTEHIKDITKKK